MTKTRSFLQTLTRLSLIGYALTWALVGFSIITNHPGYAGILINKSFILLLICLCLLGLNLAND